MNTRKMAILRVTPEALRELLYLPDGAILDDVDVPFNAPGTLLLKVSGAGWDTPEGGAIVTANSATTDRNPDGSLTVNWHLPE